MITAKEASELSGPSVKDYTAEIEKHIKAAAGKKEKQCIIREKPFADWLYHEKECSPAAKGALKVLRDNGFELDLYYVEGQFVDIGLRIKWRL